VGCVQKFLETDADYLIVLEDDLKIVDDFSILVKDILNYLYNHKELDWYLINIGAKKKVI
jgi:glycosyl transferase family 25